MRYLRTQYRAQSLGLGPPYAFVPEQDGDRARGALGRAPGGL